MFRKTNETRSRFWQSFLSYYGEQRLLCLQERPLIAMAETLLAPQYMALRPEQALGWIERLSGTCRRFGGILSLLWHNNSLMERWQKQLYLEALEVAVQ
jgi:hypothetical protein